MEFATIIHKKPPQSLKRLNAILDYSKMGKPAFLMVLLAVGQYAYRREDGVYIVPVDCLKT